MSNRIAISIFVKCRRFLKKKMSYNAQVIVLSFFVGILGATAAIIVKNLMHFTVSTLNNIFPKAEVNYYYLAFPIIGIIFLIGWGYLSNRFYSPNSSMVLTCFLINWIGVLMILCSGIMNCLSRGPLFYFLFDMIRTFFLTTHIIGTMANSLVKNLLPFNFYNSISCAFMIMLFSSLLGCIIKDSKLSDTSSF